MSWSCHPRCATGAAYTIGGTPDRARAAGAAAQGTTGDRPRGSRPADLRRWRHHDRHRCPPRRTAAPPDVRRATRDTAPPDHRRRRGRPGAPPRRAGAVGAGGVPGRGGPRRQRDPVLRRPVARAARPSRSSTARRPGSRAPRGRAVARAGSAGSPTPGPAIALVALGLGMVLTAEAIFGNGDRDLGARARRRSASGCCGVRPTRRSARAGSTSPRSSTRSAPCSAAAAGRRTSGSAPGFVLIVSARWRCSPSATATSATCTTC